MSDKEDILKAAKKFERELLRLQHKHPINKSDEYFLDLRDKDEKLHAVVYASDEVLCSVRRFIKNCEHEK